MALLCGAAAAVAAVVATLLALSHGERTSDPRATARATAPLPAADEPERVPEPRAGRPPDPLAIQGTTAFVRRLEVGEEITRLRADVDTGGSAGARFVERYEGLFPFLLAADRAPAFPEDAVEVLRQLTTPHRDLAHVALNGGVRGDRLGRTRRVRVWTIGEPYPAGELTRVSATIEAIAKWSKRDVPGGIDVLVTPDMGLDVFPLQSAYPWATGMFYHADEYCAVRSTLSARFRPEVVEHECIHALCWSIPSFSSSRFVSEGLAEYLRFVEPGDRGLDVPRERLAHQFAALHGLLAKMQAGGISVYTIDPRRLVDLSPSQFYALRHFSYLVAQLTLAYVGGDPIGRAFAEGTDAPIVAAIRDIPWDAFLAFVGEHGKGGRATEADVVEDAVARGKEPLSRDRAALGEALRGIGAGWVQDREAPDPALLRQGDAGELGKEERIVAVLEALRESMRERRCFFVATNVSATRDVVVQALPDAIVKQLGGVPEGATPRSFAKSLLTKMQRQVPRYVLAWVNTDRSTCTVEELQNMIGRFQPMNHVVLVDTGGASIALQLRWTEGSPPPVVLVVDLSEDGEGVDVALRYDRNESNVAYWRVPMVNRER